MDLQTIIVILIVAYAFGYVGYNIINLFRRKNSNGCSGGCTGCSMSHQNKASRTD